MPNEPDDSNELIVDCPGEFIVHVKAIGKWEPRFDIRKIPLYCVGILLYPLFMCIKCCNGD